MSRYSKKLQENKVLNYGWDHALGYWYDIIDHSEKEPKLVEEKCSRFGSSRGEIAETLIFYDVNEKHLQAIALDLTF
jgi:hypothetical protein